MNRIIRKVTVLGSGVMGSRIACHFAGIGIPVLLLDIAPRELSAAETAKKLTLDHPAVKNRIVNDALAAAVKSNPSPLYTKDALKKIRTGNFTDNMKDIADCDWVIEVVVERLDVKQQVFAEVEKYRKPGTLITSNTSGIPIHLMAEGRSDDFKRHSCCTTETFIWAKRPSSVKIPPPLSPTGSAFTASWPSSGWWKNSA